MNAVVRHWRLPVCGGVKCLAAVIFAGSLIAAQAAQHSRSDEALIDKGDHYALPSGEAVRLWQRADEIVVLFEKGVTETEGSKLVETAAGGNLEVVASWREGDRGIVSVFRSKDGSPIAAERVAEAQAVIFAYTMFVDPVSRARMTPSDEVLVQIEGEMGESLKSEIATAGLSILRRTRAKRMNVYVLRLKNPKQENSLTASQKLAAAPDVRWAQPNFWREIKMKGSETP